MTKAYFMTWFAILKMTIQNCWVTQWQR